MAALVVSVSPSVDAADVGAVVVVGAAVVVVSPLPALLFLLHAVRDVNAIADTSASDNALLNFLIRNVLSFFFHPRIPCSSF